MVAKEEKIKFAVVGCGHIGKHHAETIIQHPDCELVGLCDSNADAKSRENECSVPFFTSYDEMLSSVSDIDVINICTPNGLHSKMAIQALEHKKHVVVEKPMGLTKKNCEEVIFSALKNHKQVFCVMQNRYSPPAQWLKKLIEGETLGEIFMVQVNCFWNRDARYYKQDNWHGNLELDGGVLFTQFSHFVDLLYWLFGDIQNIVSRFKDFNHKTLTQFEDSGFVNFDFLNGGMGNISFSTSIYNKNFESSVTIIAEKGTVKVGGQYMNDVVYCDIKDYEMPKLAPVNPPNNYGSYKGSAANHQFMMENVVKTLKGVDTTTTNALEGLKVVEIIERMYQAAQRPVKNLKAQST